MKITNRGYIDLEIVAILGGIIFFIGLFFMAIFFALDWTTGEHGRLTITAVDKNLFGTHTIYARNSESLSGVEADEIRYCIDASDTETAEQARKAIGMKNTTLIYPDKRIGFIWFDKCNSAPIKKILTTE